MFEAGSRHPRVETMAAFVEGTLTHTELKTVTEHLRDCSECRDVVAGTAEFERHEAHAPRVRRWLLAAAMIATVLAATPLVRSTFRHAAATPLAHLIEAAPRTHRSVTARLSGFAWARLQPPSRGSAAADPAELQLAGAAGDVLAATSGQTDSEARHARGDALLLIGRRADAVAELERAAAHSTDARIWNDLAAARTALAIEEGHPSILPLALAAANRAIALAPSSAEPRFNRALILEQLGIHDHARAAWQQSLSADASAGWGLEAREHLRRLDDRGTRRFDARLLHPATAAAMVREFPQESRTLGEGTLLAEWADAAATHDDAGAASRLATLRAIGAALASQRDEHLLDETIAVLSSACGAETPPAVSRRAPVDRSEACTALIDGHRLYRDGRVALNPREGGAAEALLRRAAARLEVGGSPFANVAKSSVATAAFIQHHAAEARESAQRLRIVLDASRHRALAAQLDWTLAVAANVDGDWGAGARLADRAAAGFRSLGERKNAAILDGIAADALDLAGGADPAWQRRIRVCAALDAPADHPRRATYLRSAAVALERFGHPGGAAAILDIAADDVRDDPAQLTSVLTHRTRLAGIDRDAAERSLAAARTSSARVRDTALRETLQVQLDVAEAAVRRATDPQASIAALDRAIAFFPSSRMRQFLPDAYVERGRAHRLAGDTTAAAADYAAALREIELQRKTIDDGALRLRFLDTAAAAIEESIDLQLARGAVSEAFAIADAARAGSERTGALPSLSPGTAVIEYALLPQSLVLFCLADGQLTAHVIAIDRNVLGDRIAAFEKHLRDRADVTTEATALHRLLIAPVQARLGTSDRLVLVPDRQLYGLPFAALRDPERGEFLVERYRLRYAPAAALAGNDEAAALQPALVVADPASAGWPRLPRSGEEGARIAALYATTLLSGSEATRERFLASAARSALIHFAGHAESDASSGALLLADGDVTAADVARLALKARPLVVLAACGTFRGDAAHVSGMPGLARAFLTAGARAVIGTLWEVDDDVAAALFFQLQEHLRTGEPPADALRTAQLEMIHASDARLRHPATWAPAVLTESLKGREP
jgi:CHAT domain-containing protein/tetratricopeptide (TPR) repeat protein